MNDKYHESQQHRMERISANTEQSERICFEFTSQVIIAKGLQGWLIREETKGYSSPYWTKPVPDGSKTDAAMHKTAHQQCWWHLCDSMFKKGLKHCTAAARRKE